MYGVLVSCYGRYFQLEMCHIPAGITRSVEEMRLLPRESLMEIYVAALFEHWCGVSQRWPHHLWLYESQASNDVGFNVVMLVVKGWVMLPWIYLLSLKSILLPTRGRCVLHRFWWIGWIHNKLTSRNPLISLRSYAIWVFCFFLQ